MSSRHPTPRRLATPQVAGFICGPIALAAGWTTTHSVWGAAVVGVAGGLGGYAGQSWSWARAERRKQ